MPPDSGLTGCSINESIRLGSAAFDAATGQITIRGSGTNIGSAGDQCYFLNRPVEGDFQITVKAVTKPGAVSDWSKAGLMIRESLDPGSPHAFMLVSGAKGISFQRRAAAAGASASTTIGGIQAPRWVKLARAGGTITASYSAD